MIEFGNGHNPEDVLVFDGDRFSDKKNAALLGVHVLTDNGWTTYCEHIKQVVIIQNPPITIISREGDHDRRLDATYNHEKDFVIVELKGYDLYPSLGNKQVFPQPE